MMQLKLISRLTTTVLSAALLASCNRQTIDFPALPAVTRVTISDYDNSKNPYQAIVWQITDAQKIARLVALVDAQSAGWSDKNSANISSQTGIELKFKGPNVSRTFVVYPRGFSSSYNTGSNNLWSMEGDYPNVTITMVVKEISDPTIEKLLADIAAVTSGVKPEPSPTPKPSATTVPKPTMK